MTSRRRGPFAVANVRIFLLCLRAFRCSLPSSYLNLTLCPRAFGSAWLVLSCMILVSSRMFAAESGLGSAIAAYSWAVNRVARFWSGTVMMWILSSMILGFPLIFGGVLSSISIAWVNCCVVVILGVGGVFWSALDIRSKSMWCGGGGVTCLMGVWSGSSSSVGVLRGRGVLLLLLLGVAWSVVVPPPIIPKVKLSWAAVGSVVACWVFVLVLRVVACRGSVRGVPWLRRLSRGVSWRGFS